LSTDSQHIKEEGLAMDAPTSYNFSEIYLQYLENTKIFDILVKHHTIGCFQYIDDILLDYINNVTNIHNELDTLNKLIPTMHFTMEEDVDNRINFLDSTISGVDNTISFKIYRKPTATDIIIPNDSCHPPRAKASSNQIPNQLSLNIP
jgi:hypothetical protein